MMEFVLLVITIMSLYGERVLGAEGIFGSAQFISDWLPIVAQSGSLSTVVVPHGLGIVPLLVEVLVKSTDPPNDGFIFKAIGNGERDDDGAAPYGGVVYMYNSVSVNVFVPNRFNGNSGGAAIYTGDLPYYKGVNVQVSMSVLIKVQCWNKMPTTCYQLTNRQLQAGSTNTDDTYFEVEHGSNEYPKLVKVRAQLQDGLDAGWYVDAQGANQISFNNMGIYWRTGGFKFGYNNQTVRVWTSSWPGRDGILFSHDDGWGSTPFYTSSTSGKVEVYVWCSMTRPLLHESIVSFGPEVNDEQLEFSIKMGTGINVDNFFVSIMVQATDGNNNGYLFEGTGSAMPNNYNLDQTCAYGGLVYAYNASLVRIWRPDHSTGAALCISGNMGHGVNTQASQNGKLVIKIWHFPELHTTDPNYTDPVYMCSHFVLLGNDSGYNGDAFAITDNVSTLLTCDHICRDHELCVTFTFNGSRCGLFNTTDDSLLYPESGSQVWRLNSRTNN